MVSGNYYLNAQKETDKKIVELVKAQHSIEGALFSCTGFLEDIALKALAVPGSYLDVFTALMCTQLQIRYEKLSEQERTVLKNVMKKTQAYKDSPLSRMKRR